jgi:hypothetical protein
VDTEHAQGRSPVKLSVVIPTYNRGPKLAETIRSILRADMGGASAEIIVVDDGSRIAAEEAAGKIACPDGLALRFIRQVNAGPGPARNTGFRAATGDLIIFIDDDILVPPELFQQYLAANRKFPGAVVFGRSPFQKGDDNHGTRKFLSGAKLDPTDAGGESYVEAPVVGSGHVAFSPKLFREENRVYRDDLRTPAADEIDWSLRLRQKKIPYYFAAHIVADHCQPVDLKTICNQHYKHSMGVAEAYLLCPGALDIPVVAEHLRAHGPVVQSDAAATRLKKRVKAFLGVSPIRRAVLNCCSAMQHVTPQSVRSMMYRACLSLHYFAGFREGLRRFAPTTAVLKAGIT